MIELLHRWYYRYFSDPQAVLLTLILVLGTTVILTMGNMLAPALAAIVIAYLLEGIVRYLEKAKVKRLGAVLFVFSLFSAFVIFLLFGVIPLISIQITALIKELPQHLTVAQNALMALPEHYSFISEQNVKEFSTLLNNEIASLGQHILSVSLASVGSFVTVLVYLVLVPLLVFFFLKDKALITSWFSGFLPRDRQAASQVWHEMDAQLGNYVRGKFWEILIVGSVSFVAFSILGLKYSILMAVIVGLSVIVPYIGATVVTLPIIVVGYFQWGWGSEFAVLMIVYGIIQALDGNVLVPLLFSSVVNLHPISIIVSILVFGGLWGFWGVFFAIPLATLVNAVVAAWPKVKAAPPQEEPIA